MDEISFAKEPTKGLVSVIIPTCNKERFIGETLESVAHQSYTNWEVIVVEDGSNGGTEAIVKSFSRQHRWHRVDYSRNDRNYGAAHTRNIAFRKARGEFVALLDSDDCWLPNHLRATVDGLSTSGKDIAYSSAVMVEDQTGIPLGIWGPTAEELADFPNSMFGRSFVTPSATIMRREVLADVGPWDTYLRYCEDFSFWLRCVGAGKRFQHVPGCHCLYRKNHEGATTQRLCGTLEEVAEVTERFMFMPGMRQDTCRRFAAKAFYIASRYHRKADPQCDSSADPARSAQLLLHAWRLRPKHLGFLLEGCLRTVDNFIRRRKPMPQAPAPFSIAVQMPNRAAA